jgi:hypothetical protein
MVAFAFLGPPMRFVVPATLLLAAFIHALPVAGVLGASKLQTLYGIPLDEPTLVLMLRHRAVLFGLLAAFLAYAAFRPQLHGLALLAAAVSVVSFLALAWSTPGTHAAITRVVWADGVALVAIMIGAVAHLLRPGSVS